MSLFLESGKS